MSNKIIASVIIPTHNRANILSHCLKHLTHQTTKDYEIIVVDDASTDETVELISRLTTHNSRLRYIRLEKQVGPYAARNLGIREAKGDIIIFIDSDVLVHPRFVEDHIAIQERYKKIILQGMVTSIRSPEITIVKRLLFPSIFFGVFVTQNASIRRIWLDKAGLFDETLGPSMGYKDMELGMRLEALGLKFVHAIRRCKAYHVDNPYSASALKSFFDKQIQRGESAYYFVKKYGRRAERLSHTRRSVFIAEFFHTESWVGNGRAMHFLKNSEDTPIIPLFLILRKIMKHHYITRGIKRARG